MQTFFRRRSTLAFFAAAAVLVGIKLLFQLYPGDFPGRDQALAFTWTLVGAVILIGLLGLLADRNAGRPDPFPDGARERRGTLVATAAGVVYGLITIAMYVWRPGRNPGFREWVHMALPWSLPFYTFGVIFLEFFLRLGLLCILFWLVQVFVLRRHLGQAVFWILAGVVALYEIWPFLQDDIHAGHWGNVALAAVEPLYLSNVFEGWLLWRYGWFTPIVFRLAFYFVWHILFGGFAGPLFGH